MSFLYGILPGILIAFGMGGGTLLIYTLNLFENFSQQKMQYINLWSYIFCAAITIYGYNKKKQIDFKIMKIFLPFAIISCLISSYISKSLNSDILKKYFGFFLIALGIWQLFQIIIKYIKSKRVKNK